MVAEAYECLAIIGQDRHIPAAWKWKWLVPIPKNASKRIQNIHPIMLMEVLRKLWTGLIVDEVTSSLQRHSALSLSQPSPPRDRYSKLTTPQHLRIGLGGKQTSLRLLLGHE